MGVESVSFIVRACRDSDIDDVSYLLKQLGYSVPSDEVQRRVKVIRELGGEVFVAALGDGKVGGSVQAIKELRLAEGEFAELVSLVVDESCRKMGIGGILIKEVEQWSQQQGLGCLRIRCNNKRSDALQFYAKAGFVHKKDQAILEKSFF